MQNHNDTIIKQTSEDFFIKICTSHFICNVCVWEAAGDRTETATPWPHSYGHPRCDFLVLQMLNRRPRGPLCWLLAFFTASYQQLLWTPTQSGALSPFCLVYSQPHLVYNSNCNWLTSVLTELYNSSTPLNRLLDLWNGMFDRHQAEITVMQFTGHSLPVHQSMSVPWNFSLSHFVSQFPPTRFILITAIGMCPFLPVHHFVMASLAGSQVKIQHKQT